LLSRDLLLQRRILRFRPSQAPDIDTVCGTDEVGEAPTRWEHVHLAEDTADKIFCCVRVCQDRPIPSGYLGLFNGIWPKGAHLLNIESFAGLRYHGPVPPIQGLRQQFGCDFSFPGQNYGVSVKRVIRFFARSRQSHLDEKVPKLSRRKAGTDDRTVQVAAHLPDVRCLFSRAPWASNRGLLDGKSRQQ
jgi:hypothetical protein